MPDSTSALTWDLDSLLPAPSRPEFAELVEQFRIQLVELATASDSLPTVGAQPDAVSGWVTFLQQFETIEARAGDLAAFLGCHTAADAANKLYRQYEATLSALDPLRERIYTNVEFAFQNCSTEEFGQFIEAAPWLQQNRFFLDMRRKNAMMRLPKEEELLSAELAVDGIHAWGRLYDRVSSELKIRVMERGQIVEKSPSQIRFDSPERSVRENNFYASNAAWAGIADTCADALNHLAGTRLTIYRRLGLKDHLEMPLHRNRMTRGTLDAMWAAVSQRKACLLPYLEAKARLLGVERLAWYDQQAPLPAGEHPVSTSVTYETGAAQVLQSFSTFSPHMGDFARHAFENRWVEAENRAGKRQGAFCTGFPSFRQSRVFMTFTNTPDNVSTLAHELGHAYHSWVLKDAPIFLQDYPMNLAETASTFAEAVLADQRLKESPSRSEQLAILDHMLGDAVAYLMNIHTRFLFENRLHEERAEGELTADRLSELMLAAEQEAYLGALADEGWHPDFWISKLHFYISGLPFYNFPYTFGYLLSTGLFALAGERGDQFPEQYRGLLLATGSQETEQAVQSTVGYNLSAPEFWHKSLDVIERRVQQFLELCPKA